MRARPRAGIWFVRRVDKSPNAAVVVDRRDDNCIRIEIYPGEGAAWTDFSLDRGTARLLAKRINQCLDATVKK